MEVEDFREREILNKYAAMIRLGEAFVLAEKEFKDSVESKELKNFDSSRVKELDRRYNLVSSKKVEKIEDVVGKSESKRRRENRKEDPVKPVSESMVTIEATVPRTAIKTKSQVTPKKEVKSKESKDGEKN